MAWVKVVRFHCPSLCARKLHPPLDRESLLCGGKPSQSQALASGRGQQCPPQGRPTARSPQAAAARPPPLTGARAGACTCPQQPARPIGRPTSNFKLAAGANAGGGRRTAAAAPAADGRRGTPSSSSSRPDEGCACRPQHRRLSLSRAAARWTGRRRRRPALPAPWRQAARWGRSA